MLVIFSEASISPNLYYRHYPKLRLVHVKPTILIVLENDEIVLVMLPRLYIIADPDVIVSI